MLLECCIVNCSIHFNSVFQNKKKIYSFRFLSSKLHIFHLFISALKEVFICQVERFANHSILIKDTDQTVLGAYQCVVASSDNPSVIERSRQATIVQACMFLSCVVEYCCITHKIFMNKVPYSFNDLFTDIDSFLFDPQSANVTEGDTVTFECVTGYSAPPAVVHWERNGQLVTEPTDEAYYGTVTEGKCLSDLFFC